MSHRAYAARIMPLLAEVIIPLNACGMKVDRKLLEGFRKREKAQLAEWRIALDAHFDRLELGDPPVGAKGALSHQKVGRLLYEMLDLPTQFHLKTGSPTTARDALERLQPLDPTGTVGILLRGSIIREAATALRIKPDPDGKVRTRYVLGGDEKSDLNEIGKEGPASGRLSSRDPNLQNVREWIRQIYVPSRPKWYMLKADYNQIELRLIALESRDPTLLAAIEEDAHLRIMWEVEHITKLYGLHARGIRSWKDVLRNRHEPIVEVARYENKRIVYGWTYRMGALKLERFRGVPFARGKEALAALEELFPGVVDWWRDACASVHATSHGSGQGRLTNTFGRRRRFFVEDVPAICNFKPQSAAAHILFDAARNLARALPKVGARMIATVHDELVVEGADPDRIIPTLHTEMERPIDELGGEHIPIEVLVGRNWAKVREPGTPGALAYGPNPLGTQPWSALRRLR